MEPEIRFCQGKGGVRIAYAISGRGSPIVVSASLYRHLEHDREFPFWSDALAALEERHRVLRFDLRGTGLSERDVADFDIDDAAADLAAVVDAAGLERFALLGITAGGSAAMLYAAWNPGRVSHLILFGSSARALMHRGQENRELGKALVALIRRGWGTDDPNYRQMAMRRIFADVDDQLLSAIGEIERKSASPADAAKAYAMALNVNIVEQARRIKAPTIIFHPRSAALHTQDRAYEIATLIPGSRLVLMDSSSSHLMNRDLKGNEIFLLEVARFLGDPETSIPVRTVRGALRKAYVRCHDFVASAPYKVTYGILALLAALASVVYYARSLL